MHTLTIVYRRQHPIFMTERQESKESMIGLTWSEPCDSPTQRTMCSEGSTLIRSMSKSNKRFSQSCWREPSPHPTTFVDVSNSDAEEWLAMWRTVFARGM
jgi:hypothetical protein